jgi:predicted nucleic acid-binding protein
LTVVVDASIAVMIVVQEPGSVAAREALAHADCVAPQLILAEIASALWKQRRRGRLPATAASRGLAEARRLLDRLVALEELSEAALTLALRRDHPVYDCFYVALAARLAAPLVTADRRLLARFADDADIRLLGEPHANGCGG